MSRIAALQDAPASHRRIVRTGLVAVCAAAVIALGAPAIGHASTGKSSTYKPAGTGSGHRIR